MRYTLKACISILAGALTLGMTACQSQSTFDSPDAAVAALDKAVKNHDMGAWDSIFGPQANELRSDDPDQDHDDMIVFTRRMAEGHKVELIDADNAKLLVGQNQWAFPVPLIKDGNAWRFDTDSGVDELNNQRIGRNELRTIDCCRTLIEAQTIFYGRNNDGTHAYADKLLSSPDKKDGLYWDSPGGEDPSPIGPALALAATRRGDDGKRIPFNGYRYKLLEKQGPGAPGGAIDYRIDGKLVRGWAAVAYPAEYGVSGIMTFICGSDGVVYQKDLGDATPGLIEAMNAYDPSGGWTVVGQ